MIQLRKANLAGGRKALVLGLLLVTLMATLFATRSAEAALLEAQAWGNNNFGQLGNGTAGPNTSTNTPGGVSNLSGVKRMDGGCIHSLALKTNGTLRASGDNEFGQLGAQIPDFYSGTPVKVQTASGGTFGRVKAISAGCLHNLALKESGKVFAWGNNETGQLGNGSKGVGTPDSRPTRVQGISNVKAIATGAGHSLALKKDGTVYAWGDNIFGQLGDGTNDERTTPVQVKVSVLGVSIPLDDVKAIAAGADFSLALKEDGTVYAWGWNNHGQLGNGAPSGADSESSTAVKVENLKGVKAIAAGGGHALALKKNGTVYAWGNNVSGQLGDGTNDERTIPVQVKVSVLGVSIPLDDVKAIAAGANFSLALKEDGTAYAWGWNNHGQLGSGAPSGADSESSTAVKVEDLKGVRTIAAGGEHALALKKNGTVYAWGNNVSGQLGDGTNDERPTPVQVKVSVLGVSFPLDDVKTIAAGKSHSLALKADGTVFAWGFNDQGQLGDGTNDARNRPVAVKTPDGSYMGGIKTIGAGNWHSLAVKQ